MPVKLIQVSPSKIPGRGGSSLIHVATTEKQHQLLLACGASRDQQYDDFWFVNIDRSSLTVQSVVSLNPTERDGFTARNSMTAVLDTPNKKVVFFGGIDSEH